MQAKPNPSKRITWVTESVGYRTLADGSRSYCVNYYDSDGRERREFLGRASTEKDAKSRLARIRVQKDKGEQVRPSRVLFADYADKWLASLIVGVDITQSTYDTYAWNVERRLKPAFGGKALQRIDKTEVARLIQELKRKGYAGWTIRAAIVPLSGIFNEAVDEGVVSFNPVEKVSRKKREKPNPKPKRILTLEESETLLGAAQERGLRWQALVALFLYAGLRQGEALGLRWQDVDLEAGLLQVRKQADRTNGELRDPKAGSARDIPLSTLLRKALVAWKLQSLHTRPEDRVVSTATGSGVSHRNAHRTVTGIALACGINTDPEREQTPNLDCHALRHVFASAAIKAMNGDVAKVAGLLGHKDTEVTHRTYLHQFESARGAHRPEQDIADLDAAFGG